MEQFPIVSHIFHLDIVEYHLVDVENMMSGLLNMKTKNKKQETDNKNETLMEEVNEIKE